MERLRKNINSFLELFEEYLPVEEEKLKAAQEENLLKLEECTQKEQALSLRLKGLDLEREGILEDLGLAGRTLKEIVDMPEGQTIKNEADKFTAALKLFSSSNKSALEIVNLNLRNIEHSLEASQYANDGEFIEEDRKRTLGRI